MKPAKLHRSIAVPLSAWLLSVGAAQGAITHVDPVDIVIPFTFEGVYLDIQTAAESTPSSSGITGVDAGGADYYQIFHAEPASEDWDVNFFFGGAYIYHNATFQPYRAATGDNRSAIDKLGINDLIDGGSINDPAGNSSATLTVEGWGASGTTVGSSTSTHMGSGLDQFANGSLSQGYIAFELNPDSTPLYGWMRVGLSDDGSTGLIYEWAYEDTGAAIQVGAVPEPTGGMLLLCAAALGLLQRRR